MPSSEPAGRPAAHMGARCVQGGRLWVGAMTSPERAAADLLGTCVQVNGHKHGHVHVRGGAARGGAEVGGPTSPASKLDVLPGSHKRPAGCVCLAPHATDGRVTADAKRGPNCQLPAHQHQRHHPAAHPAPPHHVAYGVLARSTQHSALCMSLWPTNQPTDDQLRTTTQPLNRPLRGSGSTRPL